jgi:predicted ATPase
MSDALACHDRLVREAIDRQGGVVFAAGGDGFAAAFMSAPAAVAAAVGVQLAINGEPWPAEAVIRIRIGIHTGMAEARAGNYFGSAVNRTARIASAAQAGQIIVSAATAALIVDESWGLVDVGRHRFEGFSRPERVYRLVVAGMVDVDRPLRSGSAAVGNLPSQRASLVGRSQELPVLDRLLEPGSLVTVTGVGGVGKTRLALAAAWRARHRFPDGAWLVELADVFAPGDVATAVATVLGLRLPADLDMATGVAAALGEQRRLVVVDNCEHVLDAASEVVEAIGKRCPMVTVVATSREPLGLAGERLLPLRPLPVDADGERSEAARLFCERADGVLGHFEPPVDELAVIDAICRRLDGLPLAIELAAARLPTMSLAELDERLNDRFRILTRRRGAVERHQSLRTTVAWSYRLLCPDEQLLFDRLAVFAGGFQLPAADAVAGAAPLVGVVEDLLSALVDKSLVTAERRPTGTRYQQLETLRQFGEERLEDRHDAATTRRRQIDYFVAWSEQAHSGLVSPEEPRWCQICVDEWHNLRNAVAWACELDAGDAACRLLSHTATWSGMGARFEAVEWFRAALALPSVADHPLRPQLLASLACFASLQHDRDAAQELLASAWAEEERLSCTDNPRVPALAFIPAMFQNAWAPALASANETERRAIATGDDHMEVYALCARASCFAYRIAHRDIPAPEVPSALTIIRRASTGLRHTVDHPSSPGQRSTSELLSLNRTRTKP